MEGMLSSAMHTLALALWVSFVAVLTVEGNFMPTTVSL